MGRIVRQPRTNQPLRLAPDLDHSWDVNPGVLLGVTNLVANKRGHYVNWTCGAAQAFESGLSYALATYGRPLIAYVFKKVVSGARLFVCSPTKIVELTAPSTVTDRSAGAGSYTTATQWTMATQGNAVLAASYTNAMQVSTGAAFSALGGGSPKAQLVATNLNFVMLANYDDGSNQYGDGWWCSALGDYTSWTPSLTTQAANGRLLDTPGPIKALVPMRDAFIAYKDDSMYYGDYFGDTNNGIIFGWRLISDRVGCSSAHGVAVLGDKHYFVHRTGIYVFDGAGLTNIGQEVGEFFLGATGTWFTDATQFSKIQATVDELQQMVTFMGSNSSGASNNDLNAAPTYNLISGKWGMAGNGSSGTFQCPTPTDGRTYCTLKATMADLLAWDSTLTSAFDTSQVLIGSDDAGTTIKLRRPQYAVQIGVSTDAATLTLAQLGSGAESVGLTAIKPRFSLWSQFSAPPSITVYGYKNDGQSVTTGTSTFTWNATDLQFDGNIDSRIIYPGAITLPGQVELSGIGYDVRSSGLE